tara:strand:- start:7118 stop:9019 length:1902 start_codon:yes stop_codon:yes gene_type:complete
MKTCCIVVIGHVDHGKTALVRALTGIETDRLPEEKLRGLSITPGFAHQTYPSGTIDFVDAPGHADFIFAMVSGATGAQAALIVISMVEGIGAQTLEHLSIAGLLGITTGLIAVTKSDLLTPTEQAERLIGIRTALSKTPFAGAPLLVCSAQSGDGIEALHAALDTTLQHTPFQPAPLQSFLPIDRVFSLPGRGTIVTGTLLGQELAIDAAVTLQPTGHDVTIRGLQSRGAERESIQVGERIAANLRGVAVHDIQRGAVLCSKDTGTPSFCCDVHLNPMHAQTKGLKHMQEVRVMFGTSNEIAQVRIFKNRNAAQRYAQLRFKKPVVCFAGQAAILRRLSPPETIGGVVFLDPQAQPTRSSDMARVQVLQSVHRQDVKDIANALSNVTGSVAKLSDIARLSRLTLVQARIAIGDRFVHLSADIVSSIQDIETGKSNTLNALAAYHLRHPVQAMAPRTTIETAITSQALLNHIEEALLANGQIRKQDNMLAIRTHDPLALLSETQQTSMTTIEDSFRKSGLTAPAPETLTYNDEETDLLQLLIDTRTLVSLRNIALKQTLILHKDTVAAAATTLATAFPAPQPFTTSQARTALATSRRVIVPLLEHFDSRCITIRHQDLRHMATPNSVPPSHAPC